MNQYFSMCFTCIHRCVLIWIGQPIYTNVFYTCSNGKNLVAICIINAKKDVVESTTTRNEQIKKNKKKKKLSPVTAVNL